jgi:eukaryotic-like serine/threonine-protein kinase
MSKRGCAPKHGPQDTQRTPGWQGRRPTYPGEPEVSYWPDVAPPSTPRFPVTDLRERLQDGLAGRYALERELGRGGMATVFLAQDLKHDRPVALKVLHPELAATLGPERFQREIRLAARLQHPHILTVLDSGEAAGQLWFTMPYVEGESLRDRLRRERQLPLDDALRIAVEAARALDYAHTHGVVHRDIKPENILLTRDGSTLVADFGIARALGSGDGPQLTETGMAVGTPAYMSPEQAAGDRQVDARSDVYSLGCVVYEMLAAEPPFTGPTPQAILTRRFTETPRPLRSVRETVPPAVELAVSRALARAPADRFATAGQFGQALQAAVTGAVTLSGASTVPTPTSTPTATGAATRPPVPRRSIPVAAVSLSLGFLIGLGVLFAWRHSRQDADTGSTGPKRVAVLPFENVGAADDEYFADGVSDAVRGKLAALSGLEVTARSSAVQYKKSGKPVQIVGRELGVDYVLTGTVRWAKAKDGTSRVEVSPELVEVVPGHTPRTRWQQPFVASITDVFQVQADIATRVAGALDVAMGDSTRQQLAERPTASVPAYDAYLRGRSYEQRARLNVEPQSMVIARQMYEQAIAHDSGFGLAWAGLAEVHLYLSRREPTNPSHLTDAKAAAERALVLAPGAAEAHVAMGDYVGQVGDDQTGAMAQYAAALKTEPNNAELLASIATNQFWRGRTDSALASMERANALDPRSPQRALGLGRAYEFAKRYPAAVAAYDRAIALAPDQYHAYYDKARTLISWQGDVAGARAAMQQAEARIGRLEFVKKMCVACFDWTGPLAADYEHVLDQLALDGFSTGDSVNYYSARAARAFMHGDAARNRVYSDSARVVIERLVRARPDESDFHYDLGFIDAGLGRLQDATREHARYAELRRAHADTLWLRSDGANDWAGMWLLLGRSDAALDSLAVVLADTTYPFTTRAALRVSPLWARLKGNPKFDSLIAGS